MCVHIIHSNEYVKLCDFADVIPHDDIRSIECHMTLNFISICNV